MSDDLVKLLRECGDDPQDVSLGEWAEWSHKWADRIEELEAENADLKAKLEKAAQYFAEIILHCANFGRGVPSIDERIVDRCEETAANALAELTGGKDE